MNHEKWKSIYSEKLIGKTPSKKISEGKMTSGEKKSGRVLPVRMPLKINLRKKKSERKFEEASAINIFKKPKNYRATMAHFSHMKKKLAHANT